MVNNSLKILPTSFTSLFIIIIIYTTAAINIKISCFFAAGPKNNCQGIFVSKIHPFFAKKLLEFFKTAESHTVICWQIFLARRTFSMISDSLWPTIILLFLLFFLWSLINCFFLVTAVKQGRLHSSLHHC